MTSDPKKLLEEVLGLPAEARGALAGALIESLDEAVDEDAEEEWGRELQRRIRDIDSGVVETVPWSEARRTILGR